MKVSEVMIPFAQSVHPDDSLRDAFQTMKALDLDPMPVTEGERLIGVLSSAEVSARAAQSGLGTASVPVRDVMSGLTTCIRADQDADEALRELEAAGPSGAFGKLPVIDAEGNLVGAVSRQDLSRGREGENVTEGTAAIFAVESISSIADISDDPVEYMNDESFPASDPLPPPGTFGPDQGE
jgi:CBS domain-containing protein